MLTFDEVTHTYYYNGKKVPGVTGILNTWIPITVGVAGSRFHVNRYTGAVVPSEVMEEAGAKGTDIHNACQIIVQHGGIDWVSLDPSYVGPLQQFERWRYQFNPEILHSEARCFSLRYFYAGTIDLIAIINDVLCIIDIKTGDSDTVGPQLAAYQHAWCEQERWLGQVQRWVLWLPKNGDSYKFERLSNRQDWEFFKAALFMRNYLKGAA